MSYELKLIIFLILFSLCVVLTLFTINKEKKKWNNGYCPLCGKEWKQFDTNSQGGIIYKCENDHWFTCTYNIDKKREESK